MVEHQAYFEKEEKSNSEMAYYDISMRTSAGLPLGHRVSLDKVCVTLLLELRNQ